MSRPSETRRHVLMLVCAVMTMPMLVTGRVLADPQLTERVADRLPAGAVIQARIDPKPLQLPVADADDLRFVRLSTGQGLSQTRVQQIVQGQRGFLWFGTQYGLNRYDGYTFRVFAHDPSRSNSLSGVYISSLFKDRSGYLWIGSDEALDRFDPTTETFTHYRLHQPGSDEGGVIVFHINQDHEGEIWLATGSGLFRLDPETGRPKLFQHDPNDPLSLSSNDVKSTLEDRNHRFWVATRTGLDELDRSTGKVRLHVPISQPVREFQVYEDSDGLLWLGYASGGGAGLSSYDPRGNVLSHYTFAARDVRGAAFTGVYAMTQDHDGTLWIGTGGMGLLKLDRKAKRFLRYRHIEGDPDSISEDHVTALLEDGQGNMWVGLNSTEPNSFSVRAGSFRRILPTLGPQNGGERLIGSIFRDRQGTLWVGSIGLIGIDPEHGVSTYYPTTHSSVSTGVIAIAQDATGDLWLGTIGQGLKRFNPRTRSLKSYLHDPSDPKSLSDDVVSDLRFDGPDNLWVSTWNGLDRFNIPTQSFTAFKPDPQHRDPRLGRIAQDRHGTLWIAGDSGLTHFDPHTSQFVIAKHADGMPTISSDGVTCVFIDTDGILWIATHDGFDKLNADGTYTSYHERDGLAGSSVSCILEDDAGRLWLSTNKGLSSFDRKSHSFTNYSAADGLGDLTGWNTCLKAPTGELFFAGFSGVIAFHPDKLATEPVSHSPVRFTDLKIQGQSVQIGSGSVLKRSISYTDAITLSHDQRNFSLEFASLSSINPSSVRYRYKMEGLESQWNDVGSGQRVVSYSSLPSGSYVFRVQALAPRGAWSEPGAMLRIHVPPSWWASWWFRTIVGALLILLAWAAYSYRLRSIARQFEIRLEDRLAERERIARDLHDTLLQAIQGLILRFQVAAERIPQGEPTREMLDRALERADHVVDEGRSRVKGLRATVGSVPSLPQALALIVEGLAPADASPFHITVEGTVRELDPIVREEVQLLAREALTNAYRHAKANKIEAEIAYADDGLTVRVRDDGQGIDDAVLREGRPGHFGLLGMHERAKKINVRLRIWSKLGAGTEVEIRVPAAIAYKVEPRARRTPWWHKG